MNDNNSEFKSLPDGQHIFGFQIIKCITVEDTYTRHLNKHGAQREIKDRPGFRFVMRSKTNPSAFSNPKFPAFYGQRSKLYQALVGMCGGHLAGDIKSKEEAANLMTELIGHWFFLTLSTKPGSKWQKVVNYSSVPMDICESWGTSHNYFAAIDKAAGRPGRDPLDKEALKEEIIVQFKKPQPAFDNAPPSKPPPTGTKKTAITPLDKDDLPF